jgi:hypothetical protein
MTEGAQQTGSDKTAVRPFQVNVRETELTELRRRISGTEREPGQGRSSSHCRSLPAASTRSAPPRS